MKPLVVSKKRLMTHQVTLSCDCENKGQVCLKPKIMTNDLLNLWLNLNHVFLSCDCENRGHPCLKPQALRFSIRLSDH